jgi:hypothetical protein
MQPPKVDERSAFEIARDVRSVLPVYVQNWVDQGQVKELCHALIQVFARFGEMIVDRLNKAPEKNFLAFLDLLGISPLPLQASRVPVTFYLAPGSATHALVRAGTQVAAPPGPGEQKPVIFETEKELVVVSAKLESLAIKDGNQDRYTDLSFTVGPPSLPGNAPPASAGTAVLVNSRVLPHALYVPLPEFPVWPALSEIRLKIELDSEPVPPIEPRNLLWELCFAKPLPVGKAPVPTSASHDEGMATIALTPLQDGTDNLTKGGDVVFLDLPDVPALTLDGMPGRWLRCQLVNPITGLPKAPAGMVREGQLPSIKTLTLETRVARTGLSFEQAFFNSQKLDLTKDFFPFGERPKFGDTLYLASREGLSNPDAVVELHITVTNPAENGVETPVPSARPRDTKLLWEFWDGRAWKELGISEVGSATGPPAGAGRVRFVGHSDESPAGAFSDGTRVFSKPGDIRFEFPAPPAPLTLNGLNGYWIRVRIVAGDYGRDAHLERVKGNLIERELHKEGSLVLVPASFAPPSIHSIQLDYQVTKETNPSAVLTYNDFKYTRHDPLIGSFKPFRPLSPDQARPTLYFGFGLPPSSTEVAAMFHNRPISLYMGMSAESAGQDEDSGFAAPTAIWEYWSGEAWTKLNVLDDTRGVRRTGLIRFLWPSNCSPSQQFAQNRYWLRMRQDDVNFMPSLSQVLLNTTMAVQGTTVSHEILGASTGTPSQQFRTTQAPVLADQKLEVRETTEPSREESAQIEDDEGPDAITRVPDPISKSDAFWVRWHEVPNFYGSGPRDRNYVLDRVSGEITFGDGTYGKIPPPLVGNVRMTYRTGGGIVGNKPAITVTQLKSAVPYLQKATNFEAGTGGTDSESTSELLQRGPLTLRHGGRAVTGEDFEDLAMLASREVARAKCVPLFDLSRDPDAKQTTPGVISLIIMARTTDRKPRPSQDLFDRVRNYLDARRELTAVLKLVGPEYVQVDVECEISLCDHESASAVELSTIRVIEKYLHPVSGGKHGTGWNFGEEAQRSDFFALIENVPGVNHVRDLRLIQRPDRPSTERSGHFVICPGSHKITLSLEE